jgi:hypothetical protein
MNVRKAFGYYRGGGGISDPFEVFDIANTSLWDAETGVAVTGSDVDSVVDQGGLGKNLTGISGAKPVLITDSLGRKAFRFTNNSFSFNVNPFSSLASDYVAIFVLKYKGDILPANEGRLFNMINGTRLTMQAMTSAVAMPPKYQGFANVGSVCPTKQGPIPDRVHVVAFDYTDPLLRVFVNGVNNSDASIAYTKQAFTSTSPGYIGRVANGTTLPFVGDIYEMLIVKGTYTDEDKQKVYDYYTRKYNGYDNFAFLPNGKSTVNKVSETVVIDTSGGPALEDYIFSCAASIDVNNRIHVTYTNGPNHNNSLDQEVIYIYSDDFGATWSSRSIVVAKDGVNKFTNGPVFRTSTGRLILRYHLINASAHTYIKYSDNNGSSWTDIVGDGTTGLMTNDYATPGQLTGPGSTYEYDGKLFIPQYGRTLGSGNRECVLYVSEDNGLTWAYFSKIADIDFDDYEEPQIINNNGLLIAYLRSDPRNQTFVVYSWDGGVTWSQVGTTVPERPIAFTSVGFGGAGVNPNTGGVLSYGRNTGGPTARTRVHYSSDKGYTFDTQNGSARDDYFEYGNFMWVPSLGMFVGVHAEENVGSTIGLGPCSIYCDRYVEV